MRFSVRRYYGYLLIEIFLGLIVAVLIGIIIGRFFATTNLHWLSAGKKTPLWDLGWVKQRSPWGFFVAFFIASGLGFGVVQGGWAFVQWLASCFASKVMSNYERGDNSLTFSITRGVKILFHPFRRMACLLSNNSHSSTRLPSIALFDQRQRFLSDNDKKIMSLPWRFSKFSITVALVISWFLSMFVFYTYITTVVSGQSAVNNLWIYFTSSFRIFLHTLIGGIIVLAIAFVANRFAQLYLMHLDNLVYDEILPRLEGDPKDVESLKELFARLSDRIENIERILNGLVISSRARN